MMGRIKSTNGFLHRIIVWPNTYFRVAVIDLYKIYLYITIPRRRKMMLADAGKFLRVLYLRIVSEGVLKESAGLSYITMLGFIPFVTFLMLLAPDLPFLNLGEKFKDVIARNFISGSANAIIKIVDELILRRVGFNIFNFTVLIITSYSLFRAIRNTFDRILSMQIKESQDFLTQFIKFFGTILFGLLIMILLFSSSSLPLVGKVLKFPLLSWMLLAVPFVLQFFGLTFMYMLLPSVRVRRSSLIRGAFWTTVIWVAAKAVFDFYILNLTNMQAVYGVIAALPIFLMWIYINWVIILGGIVLISVINSSGREEYVRRLPQKAVRITMEMFSDDKLNQRLEGVLDKKEMKKMFDAMDEEEEGT